LNREEIGAKLQLTDLQNGAFATAKQHATEKRIVPSSCVALAAWFFRLFLSPSCLLPCSKLFSFICFFVFLASCVFFSLACFLPLAAGNIFSDVLPLLPAAVQRKDCKVGSEKCGL
jgi:hypothetical protein